MADKDDITDDELEAIYDRVDAEIAKHPPTEEELMEEIERINDGVEKGPTTVTERDRFLGCLLGGAVGDALGAPVEFLSLAEIRRTYGEGGIRDFAPAYGRKGAITDDTQMSLFTAEGLIRGLVRLAGKGITTYPGVTAHAYHRWLRTQGCHSLCETVDTENCDGWLAGHRELHHRRAPGNTCLDALRQMKWFCDFPARNNSKGCGGVMRVAPVGLFLWRDEPERAFDLGAEVASITHGHPTGSLSAGVFAAVIAGLAAGRTLDDSLAVARRLLETRPDHAETQAALEQAVTLAASNVPPEKAIARLGQGWVAEEALAVGIYCALVAKDFCEGVILAVNHGGDSDSTGSMAGNLLGTMHGVNAIPP